MFQLDQLKIAIIGLGYVGLPLAVEFGKRIKTIGFDINSKRIQELRQGVDHTLEVTAQELQQAEQLQYSHDLADLADYNFYIVTVPTPIDDFKQPDLQPLVRASQSIAHVLKKGDIVVYESTVYPGATEEVCVPVLEQGSGLVFNQDFYVGYSPERINPGDKQRRVTNILKITSGSTADVAAYIDQVYALIIQAGTYLAPSIKVAEAAKVIENTQRDVNIALINELSLIFNKMNIDTEEVLKAAGTKWNFLPFRPGLVGGHCIGVDPYYLTHKAQSIGLHPEIILAARRLNDRMGEHVATQLIKEMVKKRIQVVGSKILVMGLSFKENCPDIRNTKIVDMVKALQEYDLDLDIYDPWVDPDEVEQEYGLRPIPDIETKGHYDAIIIALAHDQFKQMSAAEFLALGKEKHVLYDLKYILDKNFTDIRL